MPFLRVDFFKLDFPNLEIWLWKHDQSEQSMFTAKILVIYTEHFPLYLKHKGRDTSNTHFSANHFILTYCKYCDRLLPKKIYSGT